MSFDKAYPIVLKHEGGYVNHPKDPGGITNLGVTKRRWEQHLGRAVTVAEMKALTPAMVKPLYKSGYWDAMCCDKLPAALALCVFDFGVNSGPDRAIKYLQRIVRVQEDGDNGPATQGAVQAFIQEHRLAQLVKEYQESRLNFLKRLPTWSTFGKGWTRRVEETETEALKLL